MIIEVVRADNFLQWHCCTASLISDQIWLVSRLCKNGPLPAKSNQTRLLSLIDLEALNCDTTNQRQEQPILHEHVKMSARGQLGSSM